MKDENGNYIQFPNDHPQAGQLIIDQDLVNFNLGIDDFKDNSKIPEDQLCVAEAFVRFAQKQNFNFWDND